ncbi:MAG: hypothetical protein GY847_33675 [Proteobacteria bacterium]|nr:hypothetical protein [Pseudomonadota bacterium]
MDQETANRELLKPIQLAQELISDAVKCIEIFTPNAFVEKREVVRVIGEAKGILVKMQSSQPSEKLYCGGAVDTMDHLRRVLEILHTGNTEDPLVVSATETLAKALAVLYPISKIIVNPSKVPDSPSKVLDQPPGAERRATRRMAIEADIGFQSETNFFMGFTEDISTGGLFIATYDTSEIGSSLNINFTLPSGYLVSAEGIVRWVREYNELTPDTMPGMGVQFTNLAIEDKEAIHTFTAERQPIFYDE